MKEVTYKLRRVNEFKYQVKDGRKVIENIHKVSGQWSAAHKLFPTIEEAVIYLVESLENMYSSLSEIDYKVYIK